MFGCAERAGAAPCDRHAEREDQQHKRPCHQGRQPVAAAVLTSEDARAELRIHVGAADEG